jgi:Dual specificity phosphatase, catalytic domain
MARGTLVELEGPMVASKSHPTPAKPRSKNGPSEIAPGIFVGGWKEAVGFEGTRICVLDAPPEDMPPATHIRIYDEEADRAVRENLDRAVTAMKDAHDRGEPVLVFCGHGVRRSPLAAAWYLHRVEHLSLDAAYDRIRSVRPKVEQARDWTGNAADLERA